MDKKVNSRILALDGLKGLAILAVVYQHLLSVKVVNHVHTSIVVGYGFLGVNLFFMISGFLLYRPYLLGQRNFNSRLQALTFYKKRMKRIYPLFLFSLFILLVFVHRLDVVYAKSALLSLTTLSQFTQDNFIPKINGVLWFMPVELMFILAFPLLVLLINKFGFKKVIGTIFVISFATRLFGAQFYTVDIHLNPVKDFFLGRLDDFAAGMILCKVYYTKAWHKNPKSYLILLGIIAFLASNLAWMLFARDPHSYFYAAIANNFVQIAFFILVLFALGSGLMAKLLSKRAPVLIGEMSYPIFLWHVPLIVLIITTASLSQYIQFFGALIIITIFSFIYIEGGEIKPKAKI
jgi:peptidoglycan/LPS O-acetylase OafA/YrhL